MDIPNVFFTPFKRLNIFYQFKLKIRPLRKQIWLRQIGDKTDSRRPKIKKEGGSDVGGKKRETKTCMGQERRWKGKKRMYDGQKVDGEERTWKEGTYERGKEAVMEEKVDRRRKKMQIRYLRGKGEVQYINGNWDRRENGRME